MCFSALTCKYSETILGQKGAKSAACNSTSEDLVDFREYIEDAVEEDDKVGWEFEVFDVSSSIECSAIFCCMFDRCGRCGSFDRRCTTVVFLHLIIQGYILTLSW